MRKADGPARAALLVLLLAAGAAAQQLLPELTMIRAQGARYGMPDPADPKRFALVFVGGVEIQRGAVTARGDTLIVLLRSHADAAPVDEAPSSEAMLVPDKRLLALFLDGNVSVSDGDEVVSGASTWHLDNTTGVATIVQGELQAPRPAGQPALTARFDTLRRLQDGTLQIEGFRYTNCAYGLPHWHIETPWAELRRTPEGRILETGDNVVRLGEVPVFWMPGATANLDHGQGLFLHRISVGDSSRFGEELVAEWGADGSEAITGLAGLFGHEGRVDAEWTITTALYDQRGFFLEPKLQYETKDSKGELLVSSIHDKAHEDHLDQPIDDAWRGRYDLTHRTKIDEHKTLDVEISQQTDENYLREYYEDEFRDDKPQETYVSYRDVVENRAFTALGSARLNDFDSQVEYKPELVLRETAEPLAGGFLTAKAFASNARTRPEDNTPTPSDENLRVGATAQVDWDWDLPGGDRLHALAGADVTWFDETVDGDHETRPAGTAGLAWTRSFHGTDPDAHSEDWNIDGLRRLAELSLAYFDRYDVGTDPAELLPIDEIETLQPVRTVAVQWRDRLQTHQDGKVVTLLDIDAIVPMFGDENRDNGGDTLGQMLLDTRWRPGARLAVLNDTTLRWRTRQDLADGHWMESYASITTGLGGGRNLHVSNNQAWRQFEFLTVAVSWPFSPKWAAAVYWQSDRLNNEHDRTGIVLRQVAHCWLVDLELSRREGTTFTGDTSDETRVALRLTPASPGDEDLAERVGGRYF